MNNDTSWGIFKHSVYCLLLWVYTHVVKAQKKCVCEHQLWQNRYLLGRGTGEGEGMD